MKNKAKQYETFFLGLIISTFSFNLFLSRNNLVTGGVSGLSIVASRVFNIGESSFILVTNLLLIVISYFLLGKEKTRNTILGSLLYPLFVYLTKFITDLIILEIDPFLQAILAGMLSGLGSGLVFKSNFTTGGTDIVSQIIEKYAHVPMSTAIRAIDIPIVLCGWLVFGFTNMVQSLLALVILSTVSNNTMLELNKNRLMYVTSKKANEIKSFLLEEHEYDVTILKRKGGFTGDYSNLIICSVDKEKYYEIKSGVLLIDKDAFVVVTKAYEQKNANKTLRKNKLKNS